MKAHFIGIGGVGMSATAKLLRDSGWQVSGSDEGLYPPISTFLESEGLPWREPYAAANIPGDANLIVIGKNARLVPETNEEVAAALRSGIAIKSFPEVLGELSLNRNSVVVAGSYGKSSCAALLAHVLIEAGQDPSYFIGAVPLSPPSSGHIGKGDLFVFEGDEYPSSNADPRSKFLHLHPAHLLLTPLAHDHVNIFPTPADYLAPFRKLVAMLPPSGLLVAAESGDLSGEFLKEVERPIVTYGVNKGNYMAGNIVWGHPTQFDLIHNGVTRVRLATTQLGLHSIENILGVAAFCLERGLVDEAGLASAIASFKGVTRRLDCKSDKTAIPVYEGFGSSVDKAKAAIAAVKQSFQGKRLLVVFEPHTFSWRSRDTLYWYDTAFKGAAKVYIFHPATQGALTHNQAGLHEIMERVRATGIPAEAITHNEAILDHLTADLCPDDVILILSSGPLGGMIGPIVKLVEDCFPAR